MIHDGCKGCKYEDFENSSYYQKCKQNAIDKYVRKTNADVIRSMTNKELAEFLVNIYKFENDGQPLLRCCLGENCDIQICDDYTDIKEWLESGVI